MTPTDTRASSPPSVPSIGSDKPVQGVLVFAGEIAIDLSLVTTRANRMSELVLSESVREHRFGNLRHYIWIVGRNRDKPFDLNSGS